MSPFLLEKLTHVVVAAAEVDALWAMLGALLVDALSQLIQSLLCCVWPVLGHEQSSESLVQIGLVTVELLVVY